MKTTTNRLEENGLMAEWRKRQQTADGRQQNFFVVCRRFFIFHFTFFISQIAMKILLIAALIDFDDMPNDDTASTMKPPTVSPPSPFSPDILLRRLIQEVREGRNPDLWREEPHGSFFKS